MTGATVAITAFGVGFHGGAKCKEVSNSCNFHIDFIGG
jgi:hypothetical protein